MSDPAQMVDPAQDAAVGGLLERLEADRLPECSFDDGRTWETDDVGVAETFAEAASVIKSLQAERRNIVSHATMGRTDGEGMNCIAVSVEITRARNELYADGKGRAERAEAERDALREALGGLVHVSTEVRALLQKEPAVQGPAYRSVGIAFSTTLDRAALAMQGEGS